VKILVYLLLALPTTVLGQISDDFEGSELSQNWKGDTEKFKIVKGQLQSASSIVNDRFGLSQQIRLEDSFEFIADIELSFATSSANYVEFDFIKSDAAGLKVRIGGSKDEVAIYDLADHSNPIQALFIGRTENTALQIHIIKRGSDCRITVRDMTSNYWERVSIKHAQKVLNQFELRIKQSSSSFFRKHRFDNIDLGLPIRDTMPPTLEEINILSLEEIELSFSEFIDSIQGRFELKDFPNSKPTVSWISSNLARLKFSPPLENGQKYSLHITDLSDSSGNSFDTLIAFRPIIPVEPNSGDLIFTELLPDPIPSVGLPEVEFIELTNTSDNYFDLSSFTLSDTKSQTILPEFTVEPFQSVLLCRQEDIQLFEKNLLVLGLKNWISLNNDLDSLSLMYKNRIVDQLNYKIEDLSEPWKSDGGWSLELVNTDYHCLGFAAWTYSQNSSGGTPGVFDDKKASAPVYTNEFRIKSDSPNSLKIRFEIAMDTLNVAIDLLNNKDRSTDIRHSWSENELDIKLNLPMKKGLVFDFEISELKDCIGRNWDSTISFGIPTPIQTKDIYINEILFNPAPEGVDYIELYNCSSELKDLNELYLYSTDTFGEINYWSKIDLTNSLLSPEGYVAFATRAETVREHYHPPENARIERIQSLPTLPDESGILGLGLSMDSLWSELAYHEDMHSLMIFDTDGVSLEKTSPCIESREMTNWQSAASSFNYGTPGYQNSQYSTIEYSPHLNLRLSPKVFSPNGDGHQDYLKISFKSPEKETAVAIEIFNLDGIKVQTITSGAYIGAMNEFVWDGSSKDGGLLPDGYYIVLLRALTKGGKTLRAKAVCGLFR